MTTALATIAAPAVTPDQLALVQKTVAADATPDELKLYLYDCARQGVHPLDKLIHFTKRKGKYTPITSIDFMRTRAADTGEYAGSDDAVFVMHADDRPASATVTVYRMVDHQRCPFTATARWSEYYPGDGDIGFMWRKMPHTMLGKCSEALALRKGFPRQLAGLYAKEELDQADRPNGGYVVAAPAPVDPPKPALVGGEVRTQIPSVPNGGGSGHLTIVSVRVNPTKNANVKKAVIVLSDGRQVQTIKTKLMDLCVQIQQEGGPVTVVTKTSEQWGEELTDVKRVLPEIQIREDPNDAADHYDEHGRPVSADDIPFTWLLALVVPALGLCA